MLEDDRRATHTDGVLSVCSDKEKVSVCDDPLPVVDMWLTLYLLPFNRELLSCNWKKPNKEEVSPNVCRLIRRTNDVCMI